jgi:plasmid maintenance system antidote protein VapI
MKERLMEFLKDRGISSTRLADQIGVQRSSISHIVSGRNKPSYDFIYKFLQHFPQVSARWLIMGQGRMYLAQQEAPTLPFNQSAGDSSSREQDRENGPVPEPATDHSQEEELPAYGSEPRIVRIVIFYSDHRFEEYRP